MARTRKELPAKVDVAHLISTGVLASVCPRPLIDEVLEETGRGSQRNRLLPAPAVRVLRDGAGAMARGSTGGSAARGVRRSAVAWRRTS